MHHILPFLADITVGNTGIVDSGPGFFSGSLSEVAVKIVNTLLLIVGVISVIVLIVSGLRYVISAGNSSSVKSAKDGILYAVVGIIVAASGYAISSFISGRF